MSIHQREKELVDRFLNGELSGIELENFQRRLQDDPSFKSLVNFHSILRSGIIISKEEELKKLIIGKINYKKTRIPYALKLIMTFLFVTVLGISFWFYLGTDSSTPDKRFTLFPFLEKEKDKKGGKKYVDSKNKVIPREVKKEKVVLQDDAQEENNQVKNISEAVEKNNGIVAGVDSSLADSEEDKDIVIRKDKLLISSYVLIVEKPSGDSKQTDQSNGKSSLTQEAIQKLNPEAGVPEEEKNTDNVMVEFWVSPVNYRGYKMSSTKIILFGIEEPDAVKLYRSGDNLYMKYGNDFFKLVNTFEFLSYQRLKEAEVPLAIRQ